MTGGCDKVEQDVDTVVAESGVTLDTGLLSQNVVVLALEVANDFAKATYACQYGASELTGTRAAHLDSLSTWSPKPGVSTTVKEIRVPSSSSSSSVDEDEHRGSGEDSLSEYRTNGDGLYLDTALDVCIGGIVLLNTRQNALAAECVDEGGATWGAIG